MASIYASKLFITSNRKDRIKAAAASPINQPLVLQLRSQLKDEAAFEDPDDLIKHSVDGQPKHKLESGEVSHRPANTSRPAPSHTSHAVDSERPDEKLSEKHSEELEEIDRQNAEKLPDSETSERSKESQEASNSEKGDVSSATNIPLTPAESTAESVSSIAGWLNATATTAGVRYVSVKNEEVWIYYNDDVNLNKVMEPVIAALRSAGYAYLEFNRLARSNNAIVFQINQSARPLQYV